MGVAAYNRGSASISKGIQRDFAARGGERKQRIEAMTNAECKIGLLEQYCRDAQSLYVDSIDADTASGLLKSNIHHSWCRKQGSNRFKASMSECIDAHNHWVNSDVRFTFIHLAACYRKARAWKAVIDQLNRSYRLPFAVPAHL